MIKSMTGFACRDLASPEFQGSIIIKSYNNRYLDLSIILPPGLARLEPRFREYLSSRIIHGKVECAIRLKKLGLPGQVSIDMEAAQALAQALRTMSESCSLSGQPAISDILGFEGIVSFEKHLDEEGAWMLLEPDLEACFTAFDTTRMTEGAATVSDMEKQTARIESALAIVAEQAPRIEETVKSQLRARFEELLGDAMDSQRILAETAVLLVRYSINEELSRLATHIVSFRRILSTEEGVGKKLDFLCQEMNREINTIGSKNILIPVAESVVTMKDALENIREQLRNIE